ncbi:MAG: GNAT family N-acetyltransferase [Archangium sp.]|nr:GNAT family N-acetyltransferase [Archangium sp.]MDP3156607.1 GNAT family N-acetyltransferase [Archangium sp.]MDP3576292.1 GNAT family N-acetyltransferase [Archangium sp.]
MAIALRTFASTDLDQVLRLHAEVFGAPASRELARRWVWSQVENLCPERSPKWVLQADGAVVGFLGTVPIPYRIGGRRVMTHSTCDFMVAPQHRFHGINLLRECFKVCESSVSLDDVAATIAVSKLLRAQQTGTMHRYLKVLDARVGLRRWPKLLASARLVSRPARAALALRDLPFFLRRAPKVTRHDGSFGASFDRLFERCLAADPLQATVERDSRYLRWRYGPQSPQAHRVVGIVETNRELQGYVVCCASRGEDHRGYILELVAAPHAPPSLVDGLVAFAVRELRRQGSWTARWHLLEDAAERRRAHLLSWGFRRHGDQYQLLTRLPNSAPQRPVWHQEFGDGEASHGCVS